MLQILYRTLNLKALKRPYTSYFPFNFAFILLAAVKFVKRYCPLCFQIHWLSFMGKCQILSFTLWGLFELRMQ